MYLQKIINLAEKLLLKRGRHSNQARFNICETTSTTVAFPDFVEHSLAIGKVDHLPIVNSTRDKMGGLRCDNGHVDDIHEMALLTLFKDAQTTQD